MVGQGLRGRNNDTVSRMDTDRVKILHTADGNAVVVPVTDDFELDLLPSRDTALDEHLPDHGVVQPLDDDGDEFFLILSNAAARTSHGIGRANDDRVADRVGKIHSCVDILDNQALGDRLPEFLHRLLKALAILRLLDGIKRRTEELHTVLRQDPLLRKLNGKVQPRLSAERGEKPIRLLLGNNLRQELHRQRLDVNTVGDIGVRHDGGGIAVDEDDLQPVFLQCTAGLRAGIVKLCGLPDNDGAGADHHDFIEIFLTRHPLTPPSSVPRTHQRDTYYRRVPARPRDDTAPRRLAATCAAVPRRYHR